MKRKDYLFFPIRIQESHDSIFKERKTIRNISDETNTEISKEQVFVILPYA